MTIADVQARIAQALASVAPEVDPGTLDADRPLRDQVDLDSMDFLRFVIEVHKRLGVEIPEADYPKLGSLREAASYVATRLATGAGREEAS